MLCPRCIEEIGYTYEQTLALEECLFYNYIYSCRCGEVSIDQFFTGHQQIHKVSNDERLFGARGIVN